MKLAAEYEHICGTPPTGMRSGGNMGLDANDDYAYFNVTGPETGATFLPAKRCRQLLRAAQHKRRAERAGQQPNLKTGEVKPILATSASRSATSRPIP